jgi:serine/threonine-protein kinase
LNGLPLSACPDDATWADFLEQGALARRELDTHLAACDDCRALVATLAADASSVAEHGEPTVPRGAESRRQVDRIGDVVAGKWQIEGLVGSGGMGRVYRARHRNGHEVALKFLHPALANQPRIVRRFRREGYVANRVEHPAVVRVLDDGDDGGPFLVMELLAGRSFRKRLQDDGPLAPDEALAIVEAAARAVAEAHRIGIVHRDIKPDNLFSTTTGDVRLLDFGLASVRSLITDESLTADGITMGTVGYMAPEQARGENARVTARSDVWSLAATAVALMTGKPIHGGRTPAEQLALAIMRPAAAVRTLVPALSPAVASVLDRALCFEAEQRHADAGEFVDDLARARGAATRPDRRWLFGVVVGGVSLVGFALMLDSRNVPVRSNDHARPSSSSASVIMPPQSAPASSIALDGSAIACDPGYSRCTAGCCPIPEAPVTAGMSHTCATASSGALYCWGANDSGQLGDQTKESRLSPKLVFGLEGGARSVAAGVDFSIATATSGTAHAWGANRFGTLADGSNVPRLMPWPVEALVDTRIVVAAGWHGCALSKTGRASCWGYNVGGVVGDGTTTPELRKPARIAREEAFAMLASGTGHTCKRLAVERVRHDPADEDVAGVIDGDASAMIVAGRARKSSRA